MLRVKPLNLFSTLDPRKLRRFKKNCYNAANSNPLRGREAASYSFEKRIRLFGFEPSKQKETMLTMNNPNSTVLVDTISKQDIESGFFQSIFSSSSSSSSSSSENTKLKITPEMRQQLQNNGDTSVITLSNEEQQQQQQEGTNKNVILVLEPDVRPVEFLESEAQIELVTAFRNVFTEFFELACPELVHNSRHQAPYQQRHNRNNNNNENSPPPPPSLTTLRIPALSLGLHDGKFDLSIERMHRAALIQAFHRSSRDLKDWFTIHNEHMNVDLFVPQIMLPGFNHAFYEIDEAWPTPRSALIPDRQSFYQGMQMPKQLIDNAPGFIGEREEIKAMALPVEEREKFFAELAQTEGEEKAALALEGSSCADGTNYAGSSSSRNRKGDNNNVFEVKMVEQKKDSSIF